MYIKFFKYDSIYNVWLHQISSAIIIFEIYEFYSNN